MVQKDQQRIKALVFDYGGVLMDWSPTYLYLKLLGNDRSAVDHFLSEVDFFTWNLEQDRGRSFQEGIALLISQFPHYRDLIRAYDERYLETVKGSNPAVVDLLQTLKEDGYPLFGLSNWPAEKFALVRQQYPFFDWFDDMVLSGEVHLVKPDPAIFECLLERAGYPAQECLFIDDNEINILAAQKINFQTILFRSPEQLEADLHQLGILDGKLG